MNNAFLLACLCCLLWNCHGSKDLQNTNSTEQFYEEQAVFGMEINDYINSNYYLLHTLDESRFVAEIDSLKGVYLDHLAGYKGKIDQAFFQKEAVGINASFDLLVLNYPQKHLNFTGERVELSPIHQRRFEGIVGSFNEELLFDSKELEAFARSYIAYTSAQLLESGRFDGQDNQQLAADWATINQLFTHSTPNATWKHERLTNHIDELGIKHIEPYYQDFMATSRNSLHKQEIKHLYLTAQAARDSHRIQTYKSVDGHDLDLHIFKPDSTDFPGSRPVLVHFHGGSWSSGKPDWYFNTANKYAEQGWVAVAVEYRIKGRHGTYPFEAVNDAKSAIRWIRAHAETLNINPNKLVVTGNSAGGHLALATALIDHRNESTDDLSISPVPNYALVNSGVYDLTARNASWITEYDGNPATVKEISPNHQIKRSPTKFLLIHGENDQNCSHASAQYFFENMLNIGNSIELHTIKNAEHFIWFGQHSEEVEEITEAFLEQHIF